MNFISKLNTHKLNTRPFALSSTSALTTLNRAFGLALIAMASLSGVAAHAVIVLGGTGTNTGPAPSNLDNYVGQWLYQYGGSTAAIPIAPDYFITAAHVHASGTFVYNNGTSTATTYTLAVNSQNYAIPVATQGDLAIYKITGGGHFSLYAPLFTTGSMVGANMVTIGDGVQRGSAVTGGWGVSSSFTTNSWGTNTVAGIIPDYTGAPSWDQYLYFNFDKTTDANGNITDPNEAILAGNDSGGPTFVYNAADGRYELGGINAAVDSVSATYNYNRNTSGFPPTLALYDARGYYYDPTGAGIYSTLISDSAPVSLSSYSVDIQSNIDFIKNTLGSEYSPGTVPEPGSVAMLACLTLTGIGFAARRRRWLRSA